MEDNDSQSLNHDEYFRR